MVGAVRAGDPQAVLAGPRTGIAKAADTAWRFWIAGDRFVSPYKRHPKAPAAEEAAGLAGREGARLVGGLPTLGG